MLDIYGTADPLNSAETHEAGMAALTEHNGCSTNPTPATLPTSSGANTCLTQPACSTNECSTIEVTQCVVENGSHCWFGDITAADCGAGQPDGENFMTNLAWEFLRRFSRAE
jgi:poly(3-hydroxybutyrate) depolymerase